MDNSRFKSIASKIALNGSVRTAGKIEFIRDQGPVRRDIRVDGFEWSPSSLRNLAKILWAAQRSHSYASSALRLLSRMPSSQFSPDGLLGGRGYIQSVKDLRTLLGQSTELLSGFTDTLYDEVNADHWNRTERSKTDTLVQDAQAVKTNPEKFVEEAYQDEGQKDFLSLNPSELNPSPADFGQPESSGSSEASESPDLGFTHQSSESPKSVTDLSYKRAFGGMLRSHKSRLAGGNSSLPLETMSGPRIEHIGPGESPYGFFNGPEGLPSDDESLEGFITDQPIYEDWVADGVSPYDAPTDGMETFLKTASDSYSMLPGSDNKRLVPIYTPGLTQEEIDFMVSQATEPAPNNKVPVSKPNMSWMWGK